MITEKIRDINGYAIICNSMLLSFNTISTICSFIPAITETTMMDYFNVQYPFVDQLRFMEDNKIVLDNPEPMKQRITISNEDEDITLRRFINYPTLPPWMEFIVNKIEFSFEEFIRLLDVVEKFEKINDYFKHIQ
jgi:hypothetical protein